MSQGFQVPPGPPLGPGSTMVAGRQTNTLAIVSLIAGIAGYVVPHPFIGGVVAIITGHMARRQIRQTGEDGAGLALAGLILGYIHLALSILLVIGLILFFVGLFAIGVHSATTTQ